MNKFKTSDKNWRFLSNPGFLWCEHSATYISFSSYNASVAQWFNNKVSTAESRVRPPEIKISRFHRNRYCPCGQSNYESHVHLATFFSFCIPTSCTGSLDSRTTFYQFRFRMVLPQCKIHQHPFKISPADLFKSFWWCGILNLFRIKVSNMWFSLINMNYVVQC